MENTRESEHLTRIPKPHPKNILKGKTCRINNYQQTKPWRKCTIQPSFEAKKNVPGVHGWPTRAIIFYVQWTMELMSKSNLAFKLEGSYHMEHVYL